MPAHEPQLDTARLITLDEFAERIGMSRRQLHNQLRYDSTGRAWYDIGGFPVAKIRQDRRHVHVHLQDVIAALDSLRIRPEETAS